MKNLYLLILLSTNLLFGVEDSRQLVKMPLMMQNHMLLNMRDHLMAIKEITQYLAQEEFDKAAEVSEMRLGMSSMNSHGASHMSQVMPKEMVQIGTSMHKNATKFALIAQEGELKPALMALSELTKSCIACHEGYRIK